MEISGEVCEFRLTRYDIIQGVVLTRLHLRNVWQYSLRPRYTGA
jgi:hypothetical protein